VRAVFERYDANNDSRLDYSARARVRVRIRVRVRVRVRVRIRLLYLPHISPTSPLHLACISQASCASR